MSWSSARTHFGSNSKGVSSRGGREQRDRGEGVPQRADTGKARRRQRALEPLS